MSKMRKLLAMVLTLAMVLGMSITTMAAGTVAPNADDHADITVKNVEVGATLSAYQIIDAAYTTEGFVRYEWAIAYGDDIKVGDPVEFTEAGAVVGLTDALIEYAAQNKGTAEKTVTVTNAAETKMDLTVGSWMILVTPPAENPAKVYNPMLASVYYNVKESGDTAAANGTTVDANDTWELETTDAYAKSTEITIEKTVTDYEYEVDETVDFTLTTTIPSYSDEYTKVVFDITDKIVNGLKYNEAEPVVKVGGAVVNKDEAYELTYSTESDNFVISFKQAYILGLAEKTEADRAVVVTYKASVTEDAIEEIGENEVTINYTHKPDETTTTKKDNVKVYTFEFDGVLQKVKEDKTALEGAEFTLYRAAVAEENVVDTWTTDKNGRIYFAGLDSDKVYLLKETKAPNGYSLNEKIYKVEFIPTYDAEGELVSYVVKVDDKASGSIVYGGTPANILDQVVNTKLVALPSTGGIGTTMFTIGGCAIMIAAAYLFFTSRKREEA